jgi:subtilase family serine protease
MQRFPSSVLLAVTIAFGASSIANGQAATGLGRVVHRSGAVYHVEVCSGPAAPGMARCHAHLVTDQHGNPFTKDASPSTTPSGYGPASLRSAYGLTNVTVTSPGTIAIIDAYGYPNAEKDLNVYRSQFGLGACTSATGCFTKINQSGLKSPLPNTDYGWALETALDLQMASAMCPTCKLVLVEANSSNFLDLSAAVRQAKTLGVHAISNSYGTSETNCLPPNPSCNDSDYSSTSAAITVSSGDSGYGVQFPASLPTVIAVGGTHLVSSTGGRGWTETAWSGAGSGCSGYYTKPAWQLDAGCGTGVAAKRTVADVSADADPATGVAVYGPCGFLGALLGRSSWCVMGGTSVGAPLIAGIYGANGAAPFCSSSSSTYGCQLYSKSGFLNDVTSGNNGSCSASYPYLCTAVTGYDGPTGLGTPNGLNAF